MDIINIFSYFTEIFKIINNKNINNEVEVVKLEIIDGDDL